jgi:MFS transporter, DHA1 family, multidrug resistance protein
MSETAMPCWKNPGVQKILGIALFAEIGYATMNISTMPVYLEKDRNFGQGVIGLVMVSYLLFEAIFKSVMGHVADRIGTRRLLITGPCISIGTSLLSLLIPHNKGSSLEVLIFVILRALDGLAVAMLWPAAFAQMNAVVKDDQRQTAMSYLNACYMIGIALAFPLGGIANDLSGVKWAGLVLATALFAGCAVGSYRWIQNSAPTMKDDHTAGLADFIESLKKIPEYLILAVVTFMGIGFPLAIFKLFTLSQFNLSESAVGGLIFPGAITMAIASGPMAKIGERIGRVRAVHLGLMLCSIGMSMIAVGAVVPFLRSVWIFALAGLPVGIGFLLTIPAWMASVSDINPEKRATNIGAVMTAQGVGAMIGAPIGSVMYEKLQPLGVQLGLGADFGRYSPFIGCAACTIAGWLLSMKILHAPKTADALPQDSETVIPVEGVFHDDSISSK